MLSEQEKREMREDAASPSRRDSFRRLKASQSQRRPSLEEYCAFCQSLAVLFPQRQRTPPPAAFARPRAEKPGMRL